ncbi:MAG: FkbM family methyltransferase, partial [Parachlamydia sp.]|nr:FkbM family methyltransferase [Parachlamydia sp.]
FHYFSPTLFHSPLIVCNEIKEDRYCSNSFIAALPGSTALAWAVEAINKKKLGLEPPNRETGPYFLREALRHGPYQQLPTAAFYPYLYNEPLSSILNRDLTHTWAIHVWGASWFDEEQMTHKAMQRLKKGDIEECRAVISENDSKEGWMLSSFCDAVETARINILNTVKHPIGINLARHSFTASPFHFLKVAFFLLEHKSDALVWQIGAGDGIVADPLRPLLINFDPQALLVEPNPYLFQELEKNYAKNKNANFIKAAVGLSKGKMVLNAVNPFKVIEKGLPEWARGISSAYQNKNPIGGVNSDPATSELIRECIESIDVELIEVADLLEKCHGIHPSIIMIDIEGMDDIVLKQIIHQGLLPEIIYYEIQCMPPVRRVEMEELLNENYTLIKYVNDVVAYRKDFFSTYCDTIYIQHGISNVYEDAIKIIAGVDL